ncbi:MAG: 1-deoxy-D-xylulose-5-phosphate reductoisomerase [Oscillospiraceae bacterium]|nr:1-deoxy-D-xylulose-5-phosphate reductoisomerase [Oscillospiraceae bacterium]
MKINLLGATGSIGTQCLDICRSHPDITPNSLTAGRNYKALAMYAREFSVRTVCIADESLYSALKTELSDTDTRVLCGREGLCEAASDKNADMTVNAIVGAAGLLPTEAALKSGSKVALANKETLVAGGSYIMGLAKRKGIHIIPIDSEHSAIFQSLQGSRDPHGELRKIILTASGGPFFGKKREELKNIDPEKALAHPNWSMGSKITIDSATMMNKGFELIEACHLFGVSPKQVEVVIHRQSILHSAVEFSDGAVIGQLGVPDMRIPIQYALTFPKRLECPAQPLSLTACGDLTFEEPDTETFGCLKSAMKAADAIDTTAGAIINGANEVLVSAFLNGKADFWDITDGVAAALENVPAVPADTVEHILEGDRAGREFARAFLSK